MIVLHKYTYRLLHNSYKLPPTKYHHKLDWKYVDIHLIKSCSCLHSENGSDQINSICQYFSLYMYPLCVCVCLIVDNALSNNLNNHPHVIPTEVEFITAICETTSIGVTISGGQQIRKTCLWDLQMLLNCYIYVQEHGSVYKHFYNYVIKSFHFNCQDQNR